MLIPKIAYASSVTTISKKDIRKLQKIIDPTYLPKIGLNRKFPKAILHEPPDYGRLEHLKFEDRQGIEQIKMFIGSIRNKKEIEKLIKRSLDVLQIEAGTRGPVLDVKNTQLFEK